MSALTDPMGFKLATLVEAQRGMTESEVLRYLVTGELPDLSQLPDEPEIITPPSDAQVLPISVATDWLAGRFTDAVVASGIAFKFNPNQPRDNDGKWTDGTPGIDSPDFPSPSGTESATTAAPAGKKITPAVIYKKHADGATVARRADGARMRWDAGAKKFVVERKITQPGIEKPDVKSVTPTASWPFRYEEAFDVQADLGSLAQLTDDDYAASGEYHLMKLPVSALIPTQADDEMEWGDGDEYGATGKPFVVDLDGDLFLIDGHHRAKKAGPHGQIEAWVRPVDTGEQVSWHEITRLTKTAAYEDTKVPGRWFEPGDAPAQPTQQKIGQKITGSPVKQIGEPGAITKITSVADAQSLRSEVTGDTDSDEYIRRALDGLEEFGPEVATTYVSRDESGKLTGAMTIVDHVTDANEDDLSPYSVIDYIGARGDGAGRKLVKQAIEHALETDTVIYAEPTSQSSGFWAKMGFRPDPLGEGVDFHGLTYDEAVDWPPARTVTPKVTPKPKTKSPAKKVSSKLTPEERAAVKVWQGAGHEKIQEALRNGDTTPEVALLDAAIEKQKPLGERTLYRAVTHNYTPDELLTVGNVFTDPGYMATSKSHPEGTLFENWHHIIISTPANAKGLDVRSGPYDEVLLPRGSRLRIDKVDDTRRREGYTDVYYDVYATLLLGDDKPSDQEIALDEGDAASITPPQTSSDPPTVVEPTVEMNDTKKINPTQSDPFTAVPLDGGQTSDANLRRTVANYRGPAGQVMNASLRGWAPSDSPITRKMIKTLDDAMAKSKLTDDVTVHRGVRNTHLIFGQPLPVGDATGFTWTDGGFPSTTVSESAVDAFTDASSNTAVLSITVPAGVGAIKISDVDDEGEILLNRGLTFRVTRDNGVVDGRRQLDVEVLRDQLAPVDEVEEIDDKVIVAATEAHTGAMIALVPTDADAQRLAVDGGEPADELHTTICYLGQAALIPPEVRDSLIDCVTECAMRLPTIIGEAFAVSAFNPVIAAASGREPCVTALVSGSLLQRAYDMIAFDSYDVLGQAGVAYPTPHKPWIPHITLVYTDDADASVFVDRLGPVTYDRVRLAFGGDVYDIPLGDHGGVNDGMLTPQYDDGGDET